MIGARVEEGAGIARVLLALVLALLSFGAVGCGTDTTVGVFVVNIADGTQTRVAGELDFTGLYSGVAWSPDGRRLATVTGAQP